MKNNILSSIINNSIKTTFAVDFPLSMHDFCLKCILTDVVLVNAIGSL